MQPFQGQSILPLIVGTSETVHSENAIFGWEVFGHLAIRQGDWKLLKLTSTPAVKNQRKTLDTDRWGLYNMAIDPGEVNDLSDEHPEVVEKLLADWDHYVSENNIIPAN